MRRNLVIYTGGFRFPDGDAAAARVLGIGRALRDGGFEVRFGGGEPSGRPQDRVAEGVFCYDGFQYTPQHELRAGPEPAHVRAIRILRSGARTARWVESSDLAHAQAIVVYNPSAHFLYRIISVSRRYGIAIVLDLTEWYSASQMRGLFSPAYASYAVARRVMAPKAHGLLCISSFLESYYINRGCRTLRVPPLVDLREQKWNSGVGDRVGRSSAGLSLVYAGTPGKKDLLCQIVEGVALCRQLGHQVGLEIIGPSRDQVQSSLHGSQRAAFATASSGITYSGRISHRAVPARLQRADFSVLLRPDERYAQAGFPTKVVESLAASVPVITNPTSDIGQYVRDGYEGLLVRSPRPEHLAEALVRALKLPRSRWAEMRCYARAAAERSFDYRGYVPKLTEFFEALSC